MRRCWSSGGRSNSSSLSVVQLMVGEREPTEISTARFMNLSLIIRNGRNSGSTTLGLGPHHHRVRRADPVHLRHRQLALIRPAASENDVALAKAELRADDIAALAPPPDVETARIQIIQTHVNFLSRIGRLHALVDLSAIAEGEPLPAFAVENWEVRPVGIGVEVAFIREHLLQRANAEMAGMGHRFDCLQDRCDSMTERSAGHAIAEGSSRR